MGEASWDKVRPIDFYLYAFHEAIRAGVKCPGEFVPVVELDWGVNPNKLIRQWRAFNKAIHSSNLHPLAKLLNGRKTRIRVRPGRGKKQTLEMYVIEGAGDLIENIDKELDSRY